MLIDCTTTEQIRDTLKATLSSRIDGEWELLATAAGNCDALELSVKGITSSALELGSNGPARDPTWVWDRVDAVAARNPQVLVELSRNWKCPHEISTDLHDAAAGFWCVAWTRSLRHLKEHGAIQRVQITTPLYMISEEVNVLWETTPLPQISWSEAIARFTRHELPWNEIRRRDRVPLMDRVLSAADMRRCLDANEAYRCPLQLLRMLRGQLTVLDDSAIVELASILTEWRGRNACEVAGIIETLRATSCRIAEETLQDISEHFLSMGRPRDIASLAYVLLNRGWQLP